jgi:hypothetical protein
MTWLSPRVTRYIARSNTYHATLGSMKGFFIWALIGLGGLALIYLVFGMFATIAGGIAGVFTPSQTPPAYRAQPASGQQPAFQIAPSNSDARLRDLEYRVCQLENQLKAKPGLPSLNVQSC